MDVGDGCARFGRKLDRRARDHTVDVVHAEADPLEVERRDGAVERFSFSDERREMFMRRERSNHGDEIGEAVSCRLAVLFRHDVTIVW